MNLSGFDVLELIKRAIEQQKNESALCLLASFVEQAKENEELNKLLGDK